MERSLPSGTGVHPRGFADGNSANFHGDYLKTHGFPLADCRRCHGQDYRGGFVDVSCDNSGCHTEGVESCTTCHAKPPATGAHLGHDLDCASCHPGRTDARSPGHPDGKVDIAFGALASTGGAHPSFDPTTATCSDVYCHGGRSMTWTEQGKLGCDACHGDPPASHAQFATVSSDLHKVAGHADCASCHKAHGPPDASRATCLGCHADKKDHQPEARVCNGCHTFKDF